MNWNTITSADWAREVPRARAQPNAIREKIQRAALKTIRLNLLAVLGARAQAEHLFDGEARTKVLTGYEPAGPCRVFATSQPLLVIRPQVQTMKLASTDWKVVIPSRSQHMIVDGETGKMTYVRPPKAEAMALRIADGRAKGEARRNSP